MNKPVAWMTENRYLITQDENLANMIKQKGEEPIIPLYTHPVKELTDEEIISLTGFKDNPYDIFIEYEKEDLIDFAKAILRKAQEK